MNDLDIASVRRTIEAIETIRGGERFVYQSDMEKSATEWLMLHCYERERDVNGRVFGGVARW